MLGPHKVKLHKKSARKKEFYLNYYVITVCTSDCTVLAASLFNSRMYTNLLLQGSCLLCKCPCLHLFHLQLRAQLEYGKLLGPYFCLKVASLRGKAVNLGTAGTHWYSGSCSALSNAKLLWLFSLAFIKWHHA